MTRGKILTEFEKGQIASLSSSGLTNRAIVKKIEISKTFINNFVNLDHTRGVQMKRYDTS